MSEAVQLPPGLRPMALTDEEAASVRALLTDPAAPRHAGREMALATPESVAELLRLGKLAAERQGRPRSRGEVIDVAVRAILDGSFGGP